MSRRRARIAAIAWVALAIGLASQACIYSKKTTDRGTNLGSGIGTNEPSHPPGVPAARPDD
jgi:hypothetical protein